MPHTHRAAIHAGLTFVGRILNTRTARGATLWHTLAGLVALLIGATALGMLAGGASGYTSHAYDIIRLLPGNMRSYGCLLTCLFLLIVYGFGQHQEGRGHILRVSLALTAGWYVAWLLALIGTSIVHGQLYSWSALVANAFIALVANLVARHVPPDRG